MRTAKTLINLGLIRVFAGSTCHFVGFVMRRLKYCYFSSSVCVDLHVVHVVFIVIDLKGGH